MKKLLITIFAITIAILMIGCGNSKQKKQENELKNQLSELESLLNSLKSDEQSADNEQLVNIEALLDSLKNNASLAEYNQPTYSEEMLKGLNVLGIGNLSSISSFSDIKLAFDQILNAFGISEGNLVESLTTSLKAFAKADSIMNASTNTFTDINERANKQDTKK